VNLVDDTDDSEFFTPQTTNSDVASSRTGRIRTSGTCLATDAQSAGEGAGEQQLQWRRRTALQHYDWLR